MSDRFTIILFAIIYVIGCEYGYHATDIETISNGILVIIVSLAYITKPNGEEK